jgi:hypothetical protein
LGALRCCNNMTPISNGHWPLYSPAPRTESRKRLQSYLKIYINYTTSAMSQQQQPNGVCQPPTVTEVETILMPTTTTTTTTMTSTTTTTTTTTTAGAGTLVTADTPLLVHLEETSLATAAAVIQPLLSSVSNGLPATTSPSATRTISTTQSTELFSSLLSLGMDSTTTMESSSNCQVQEDNDTWDSTNILPVANSTETIKFISTPSRKGSDINKASYLSPSHLCLATPEVASSSCFCRNNDDDLCCICLSPLRCAQKPTPEEKKIVETKCKVSLIPNTASQ